MRNFLKYSKLLGGYPSLVQGGGGNTSVKLGNNLFVKASGYFLKEVGINKGHACCKLNPIKKYLSDLKKYRANLDLPFNKLIEKNIDPQKSFGKPSIEIGLHAIINSKFVFHSHNAYANIFNFMRGGENFLQNIFQNDDILLLDYFNPGIELAYALFLKQKTEGRLRKIIFLKNHGLITHSDNAKQAYNLTQGVSKKIQVFLRRQGIPSKFKVGQQPASFSRHLFPDSAVFSQVNFNKLPPQKKQVYFEICSVINFTTNAIKKIGGGPEYLKKTDIAYIQNMEKEKYRIKLISEK